MPVDSFPVGPEQEGATVAAVLRAVLPGLTWNAARRAVAARRVKVRGELCLDPARRVHVGETVQVLAQSEPVASRDEEIVIRHLDPHVVVVEKPSGLSTVRHPSERAWNSRRKALSPTLEDIVPRLIAARAERPPKGPLPRLRVVQRLDKETSGLVVFARSVTGERELGQQFKAHTVVRRYLAVVPGVLTARRVASRLVRDRGDGRRGSTSNATLGKEAVTHVDVAERLPRHTILWCRLETGRTHQIRIHLSEMGHPICGEKVYDHRADGTSLPVCEGAPRLALHAAELGFIHPVSGEALHWSMSPPPDLQAYIDRLRGREAAE